MEAAIRMRRLAKSYGSTRAVDSVDLAIYPGEMVGVVGPDGSGKTTLTRLAVGAIAPSSGQVEPDLRGRAGYLSARFSLYPDLTVWENLSFFTEIYGMDRSRLRSEGERLLDWVGLLPFRDRMAGALSGGMRQKLALICSVIHKPPVLILDEPTTAVDPVARAEFWELLRQQAAEGRAILVTTPYLDEAEFCHRIGLLHQGRLLALGTASELKAQLPHQMAFLTPEAGSTVRRAAVRETAERLPGLRWAVPLGTGVRVALQQGAPLQPPAGYQLTPALVNLEDVYVWLAEEEVPAS